MPLQMKLVCFLCIAKMNFIDTDLICLVTAQMSYYSNSNSTLIKCSNLTQKIMDKNGFIKVKMPIKCKNQFKLIGKV